MTKNLIHVAPDGQPEKYQTQARGTHAALSPDGKTVYYVGEGPDQQGIFAVSSEGGSPKRYNTEDPTSGRKSLSPDGSTISYFMDSDDERGLFSVPVSGGEPRLLMKSYCNDCCKSVYYSPDGKLLAYTSGDGLFLISSDGTEPKKLVTLKKWESWTVR